MPKKEHCETSFFNFHGNQEALLHLWSIFVKALSQGKELFRALADKSVELNDKERAMAPITMFIGDYRLQSIQKCKTSKKH